MEPLLEDILKESREKKDAKLHILTGYLSEIPDLHEYDWIEELKIYNNKIIKINASRLPPKLKKLELGKNCIELVEPTDLIPSIEMLNLSHNKLVEFDGERFHHLKILYVAFNDIEIFTFPPNIVELTTKQNKIKHLPEFPKSLRIFDCSDNDLSELPDMNDGLDKIDFSSNKLMAFPYFPDSVTLICGTSNKIKNVFFLPLSLQYLELRDNHINNISCPLPQGLLTIDLAENLITELPDFPKNVQEVNLNNNRIFEFHAIPDSITSLDISNNCLETDPRIFINDSVKLLCDNNNFNDKDDDRDDEFSNINFNIDDDKGSDAEGFWSSDYPSSSYTKNYYFDSDLDYKPTPQVYDYKPSTSYQSNYDYKPSTSYQSTYNYKPTTTYYNRPSYTSYTSYTPSKTTYKFKSSNPNYISANYKKNIVV